MTDQGGFTTIMELVVVTVLIGLLTAIAASQFSDLSESAAAAQCKANESAVEAAAAHAFADSTMNSHPVYPAGFQATMSRDNSIPRCSESGIAFAPGNGYDPVSGLASCPANFALQKKKTS